MIDTIKQKQVIISKKEIEELEKIRLQLHDLMKKRPDTLPVLLFNVTNRLYNITHRKDKEV